MNVNLHKPADCAFSWKNVTFAIVEAEVPLYFTDALTGQPVYTQISSITNALRLARPAIHRTLGKLVAGLELTRICPVT